jgi:hypothetical protein
MPPERVGTATQRWTPGWNMWMDHPGAASPHDLLENDEWRELFYRVGPHHVYMYGEMADVHARRGRAVMMPTLVETAYQRK